MRKGIICFDMDGTIADLYGVDNWLEKLRVEDASPYLEAKPLVNMVKLRQLLEELCSQGWEIRIISWLAKDSSDTYKAAVRKAKLDWLNKWDFPFGTCHLVAYGTTKADCIRRSCEKGSAILIDDNVKVREGWHMGDTIDPTEENWLERLEGLLKK